MGIEGSTYLRKRMSPFGICNCFGNKPEFCHARYAALWVSLIWTALPVCASSMRLYTTGRPVTRNPHGGRITISMPELDGIRHFSMSLKNAVGGL
jgi:hypothetical protein